MRDSTRTRIGSLVAVALMASAAACGSSGQDDRGADAAPTPDPQLPTPEQAARFALLRTAPEGIPAPVRNILRVPIPGLDWSLAQRVPFRLRGAYWLVPGPRHLCIVARTPGAAGVGTICATTADASEHGVAHTALDSVTGTRLIAGVAPDGTRTVLVRTGRAVSPVPTRDGRFTLRDAIGAPADRLVLR